MSANDSARLIIVFLILDPYLFEGTIRFNLDPHLFYSDDELWEALDKVGLKDYVGEQEGKLDSVVASKGENLSLGQRQLICLAAAILVKPKILVMDEATSSVDGEADQRIQQVLSTEFAQTTIIAIAHRLQTIARFDRVLVLDQGELLEFDSPKVLLSNPQSSFSQLVDASGQTSAQNIREIAFGV